MQAPQQLFESRSVAALHEQDQKNVVLLRGHREALIPYLKRDEHARTVRTEGSFFPVERMHSQSGSNVQSLSAGVPDIIVTLVETAVMHASVGSVFKRSP